ncbi:AT-hook motif nuclear-localized protein 22-like [Curcuma longa]|uniref:AT-hook motif nuclear-localized protein 22-like n=1 Tax=Curcuma longa TaxID=136217 RepID=UPI003D9DE346
MDHLPPSYLVHDLHKRQRLQQSNVEEELKDVSSNSNEESSGGGGGGGAAGEQGSQRRRGRPPGSRNRPKPPVVITPESGHLVRAHVMEVAAGHDVVESVAEFARRRRVGLGVISGRGTVAAVTVRGPDGAVLTLRGLFEVVSISGSVLPPPSPPAASWLTVYLVGPQGQVVGGSVVGPMVAAVPVMIMATSFGKAAYEKLPLNIPEQPLDQNIPLQESSPAFPPLPQQLAGAGNSRPPFQGHLPPLPGLVNNNLPPPLAGDDLGL